MKYTIEEREGSDTRISHFAVVDEDRDFLDFVCECDRFDDAELIIELLNNQPSNTA